VDTEQRLPPNVLAGLRQGGAHKWEIAKS
jgi:hypothetical protein